MIFTNHIGNINFFKKETSKDLKEIEELSIDEMNEYQDNFDVMKRDLEVFNPDITILSGKKLLVSGFLNQLNYEIKSSIAGHWLSYQEYEEITVKIRKENRDLSLEEFKVYMGKL